MTHPLVGTWTLALCEHTLKGGKKIYPFGKRPRGRLVYTAGGKMIVMLMSDGRPRCASGSIFEANARERAAAAETFLAYSGTWRLQGGKVRHQVDLSLFPNWVGSTQMRSFKVSKTTAEFWTRPFTSKGVEQVARLVWKREK